MVPTGLYSDHLCKAFCCSQGEYAWGENRVFLLIILVAVSPYPQNWENDILFKFFKKVPWSNTFISNKHRWLGGSDLSFGVKSLYRATVEGPLIHSPDFRYEHTIHHKGDPPTRQDVRGKKSNLHCWLISDFLGFYASSHYAIFWWW